MHPWINYKFCVVSELLKRSWKDKQGPSVNLNIQLWLLVSDSLDLISFCSFCYHTDWKLQLGLGCLCLEIYTEVAEEKGSQMVSNKILSVLHSISSKSQKWLKISSFSDISLCLPQTCFWKPFSLSHFSQSDLAPLKTQTLSLCLLISLQAAVWILQICPCIASLIHIGNVILHILSLMTATTPFFCYWE